MNKKFKKTEKPGSTRIKILYLDKLFKLMLLKYYCLIISKTLKILHLQNLFFASYFFCVIINGNEF